MVDQILVCGLGSLGQHCVQELTAFGAQVSAIDIQPVQEGDVAEIGSIMDQFFLGDCRDEGLLKTIDLARYRAILLVTSNDRVNIEAAMTARMLNPHIRVVMRSSKEELNTLLTNEIGNFISFEPETLAAPAFAMAALTDERLAQFHLRGRLVQITREPVALVSQNDEASLSSIAQHRSSILGVEKDGAFAGFKQYQPTTALQSGDAVITLTTRSDIATKTQRVARRKSLEKEKGGRDRSGSGKWFSFSRLFQLMLQLVLWVQKDQIRRVVMICSAILFTLLLLGGISFLVTVPQISPLDALYATAVLILGGYSDLLGDELRFELPVPGWLRLFGLLLTISGTLFVGLVYAVFTQNLLSMRFRFKRDVPLPSGEHVIIYPMRRVGLVVAEHLLQFGRALVGVDEKKDMVKKFPYIARDGQKIENALLRAKVERADCLVALARDELENLEVGLLARALSPDIKLVIRTHEAQFSKRLSVLWPKAHILSTASLAAEAFAAAAFGENVPFLFRLGAKTILVTEYQVEEGDSLGGRTIGYFCNAFGVVPLLLVKKGNEDLFWLPADDTLLEEGDIFYLLATIDKLTRIEHDHPLAATHLLWVDKPLNQSALFEGANVISRFTGLDIASSREFMDRLPAAFPNPLYLHQGLAIVAALKQNMVWSRLEAVH